MLLFFASELLWIFWLVPTMEDRGFGSGLFLIYLIGWIMYA